MKLWNRSAAAFILFVLAAVAAFPPDVAGDTLEKRSTLALTFREGQGTDVALIGVAPRAGVVGKADVKRNEGRTRIKLDMQEPLPHPQSLGSLYTTYVLWAVAPEGRAESLAELPHSKDFDVDATTALPTFGLIVTAEPHAAVSRPGPRLVAESGVRGNTRGRVQGGTVQYEATPERLGGRFGGADFTTPLVVLGARRAVEMAKAAGASEYAAAELREADVKLGVLEETSRGDDELSRDAEALARDVMRLAEHARVSTADRIEQAGRTAERRAARAAIDRAQTEAERAAARAERDREEAARAAEDADRATEEAMKARSTMQRAESEAERAGASEDLAHAEADRARLESRQLQQETLRAQRDAQRAQQDAQRAQLEAQQAQQDKAAMQEQLFRSLSAILETRREARGLIVNLSDVLFDFNRASLKPGTREKLSKLAGILLAYPGPYNVEIEGHTDSVGSPDYNLRLSQDRADSVASYLRESGIPMERVARVTGFGEERPVTGNDTAAGRQMNRRVELVITDLES